MQAECQKKLEVLNNEISGFYAEYSKILYKTTASAHGDGK